MNKMELKQEIVNAALAYLKELHGELIEEAELKLHTAGEEDGIVSGSIGSGDMGTEDMSKETAFLRKEEAYRIEQIINFFQNCRFEKAHDVVEPLAVVMTNRGNFFVSRAVKDVTVDGKKYHLLAQDAPIYSALVDKKKGDKFKFNNLEFEIQDLF